MRTVEIEIAIGIEAWQGAGGRESVAAIEIEIGIEAWRGRRKSRRESP